MARRVGMTSRSMSTSKPAKKAVKKKRPTYKIMREMEQVQVGKRRKGIRAANNKGK
jgi:hypothetical protein